MRIWTIFGAAAGLLAATAAVAVEPSRPREACDIAGGLMTAALANTGAKEFRRPRDNNLKVGDPAPAFTVKDVDGKTTVKLETLQGKPVVLVFGSCT